jgi:hypothetical protein
MFENRPPKTLFRRQRQRIRPTVENLETRSLLSGVTAASGTPIFDSGKVPFQVKLTRVNIPDAPGLQSAASAQSGGKWLFIGGRTNGLHSFDQGQNFPPEYQNTNIIVIDPKTRQVWSRPWSSSTLSTAAFDALTSSNQEADQQGNRLYIVGGYGVDSNTNISTTFDTLTAINVSGLINAVIRGGHIAAQVRQIQNPIFQDTGGQLGKLGNRDYLVMGQSFLGDYSAPPAVQNYVQNYLDQIQSFQIVDTSKALSIRKIQTITNTDAFHRRDFGMTPAILPNGQQALEVYGGVFTPDNSVYRQPITITNTGRTFISTYNQYFSQYDEPQVPLYSAKSKGMQTIFLGGISLYNYIPSLPPSQAIKPDPDIPFVNTITDLFQNANGSDREYILPVQLPGLLGASAQFMAAPQAPHYSNGVLKLDAIRRPTTVGYMYGGILAKQANGNDDASTPASNEVFKVTLIPRKSTS